MLDIGATQQAFADLVGVSQQAISKQVEKGVLRPGQTMRQWLLAYCEHLRDQAAGRGGDDQANLTRARAEEAQMKTANLRLDYNMKLGAVVVAKDAADAIGDWCRFANREYLQGLNNIVLEIQSAHNITVDNELVERIAHPTIERIKGHADKLGRDLVAGEGDVLPARDSADT